MFNRDSGLRSPLLVVFLLRLGLLDGFCQIISCFGSVVAPGINKLILVAVRVGSTSSFKRQTYVSEHDASLLEYLGLVVVINVELLEQDFVLVT